VLKWGIVVPGLAIVTSLILSFSFSQHDDYLHVAFIDIVQCDASLTTTPSSREIMVEGGSYPSVIKD